MLEVLSPVVNKAQLDILPGFAKYEETNKLGVC
jgi:hypothetical protein